MAHQNETPPEGGELSVEADRIAADLAEAILHAMRQWAIAHRFRHVNADLPLAALFKVIIRCLQELPADRQHEHVEDLILSFRIHLQAQSSGLAN